MAQSVMIIPEKKQLKKGDRIIAWRIYAGYEARVINVWNNGGQGIVGYQVMYEEDPGENNSFVLHHNCVCIRDNGQKASIVFHNQLRKQKIKDRVRRGYTSYIRS